MKWQGCGRFRGLTRGIFVRLVRGTTAVLQVRPSPQAAPLNGMSNEENGHRYCIKPKCGGNYGYTCFINKVAPFFPKHACCSYSCHIILRLPPGCNSYTEDGSSMFQGNVTISLKHGWLQSAGFRHTNMDFFISFSAATGLPL